MIDRIAPKFVECRLIAAKAVDRSNFVPIPKYYCNPNQLCNLGLVPRHLHNTATIHPSRNFQGKSRVIPYFFAIRPGTENLSAIGRSRCNSTEPRNPETTAQYSTRMRGGCQDCTNIGRLHANCCKISGSIQCCAKSQIRLQSN